jgi:hypothetical protein
LFEPSSRAQLVQTGWRISPEQINISLDSDRPLQLLDDEAQELHGAMWSLDDPEIAEIQEQDGIVVIHPKKSGKVHVTAALGGEMRSREIVIWPSVPMGSTNWAMHGIGRNLGDIPAVPTSDGPHMFSLEQTRRGKTILRANSDEGMQLWRWVLPENNLKVELVCGDWLGGAVISSNRPDSYTLYVVGKDGKLRWKHDASGQRKALSVNVDHTSYLLTQSIDGTAADLVALDQSGKQKFDLQIPSSQEIWTGVKKQGSTFECTGTSTSHLVPMTVSRVMVNMDGLPYIAFSQSERRFGTEKCVPGSSVPMKAIYLDRDEKLVLWQVHSGGTYRTTMVQAAKGRQPLSAPLNTLAPTESILTDNMNGMLVPVRVTYQNGREKENEVADELVYRFDPDGEVVYKMPLPRYSGNRHDETVIGENDVAFTTRGTLLIAFNVRTGQDLWHWESNTPDIEVYAALANGHVLVQTPTALVEVESATEAKEFVRGKARMDWQGRIFVQSGGEEE